MVLLHSFISLPLMTHFTGIPLRRVNWLGEKLLFSTKYRKEIISITSKTAEKSKDFVLLQKENLKDLLAETREDA